MTDSAAHVLASIREELAAMENQLDTPGDWTLRERRAYEGRRALLDLRANAIVRASARLAALAEADAVAAADQKWLEYLAAWRQFLCDEFLALPPRIETRNDEGKYQNLKLSITAIDRGLGVLKGSGYALETLRLGALMRDSGFQPAPAVDGQAFDRLPWYGSVAETEDRIKDLGKERAAAQTELDDALEDDTTRARVTAHAANRAAELNAGPQRKTRGDGSQFDKYPDGRRVEVPTV